MDTSYITDPQAEMRQRQRKCSHVTSEYYGATVCAVEALKEFNSFVDDVATNGLPERLANNSFARGIAAGIQATMKEN